MNSKVKTDETAQMVEMATTALIVTLRRAATATTTATAIHRLTAISTYALSLYSLAVLLLLAMAYTIA